MNTPLHNLEAEQTVIGAVLVHPESMVNVGPLDAQVFYDPKHTAIWSAIRALDADQEPIDQITIAGRMVAAGTFDLLGVVGGRDYFAVLGQCVVTIENVGYHAGKLRRLAKRRAVQRWAQRVAIDSADEGIDTEDFLDLAERGALQIMAREEQKGGPMAMYPMVKEAVRSIEERAATTKAGGVIGIATGIAKWDAMTQGLQAGDLHLVGARPSMGKTALLLNWLACAVEAGEPALFFSLEMRNRVQIERMLSKNARVSAQTIRRGQLDRGEWAALRNSASRMSSWPLEIDERGVIDAATIRTTARQWRARLDSKFKDKIGIVAVDYVGLISSPQGSGKWEVNRAREISEMALCFKHLASELGVAFVLLAQLNRKLEERADRRPILADLKESGSLEEHADVITFIYRDVIYSKQKCEDPDAAEIIIGKQRNGPTGTVDARWDSNIQSFYNADQQEPKPVAFRSMGGGRHPYAPDDND